MTLILSKAAIYVGVLDDDWADDHGLHLLHHVLRLLHLHQVNKYYIIYTQTRGHHLPPPQQTTFSKDHCRPALHGLESQVSLVSSLVFSQ